MLTFITASIWFLIAYSSPCRALPPQVRLPSAEPPASLPVHAALRTQKRGSFCMNSPAGGGSPGTSSGSLACK